MQLVVNERLTFSLFVFHLILNFHWKLDNNCKKKQPRIRNLLELGGRALRLGGRESPENLRHFNNCDFFFEYYFFFHLGCQ